MIDRPSPDPRTEPLYPRERARLLRAHADTLIALLSRIARSPHAPSGLPSPALVVGGFMSALLVWCVRADGHHTGGELYTLQEYHSDGWDLRDTDKWLSESGSLTADLHSLRPFMSAARLHDAEHGTSLVASVHHVVADVGALMITSDGHTAASEGRGFTELLQQILA